MVNVAVESTLDLCLFCIFPGAKEIAEFIIYIPSVALVTTVDIIYWLGVRIELIYERKKGREG